MIGRVYEDMMGHGTVYMTIISAILEVDAPSDNGRRVVELDGCCFHLWGQRLAELYINEMLKR